MCFLSVPTDKNLGWGKGETLEKRLLQYFLAENPIKFSRNW